MQDQHAAVAALAALGQSTRLRLFQLLVAAGAEGLSAGKIAEQLGVKQNTLSTHLSILQAAGMIAQRRSGRSLIYRPSFFGMRALLKFLVQDCCDSHPAVCKPLLSQLAQPVTASTSASTSTSTSAPVRASEEAVS